MRVKKVNRYYCEFCKKAGCSGGHIKRHEESCTLNPNRTCRMCKMIAATQKPIAELVAILPNPENFINKHLDGISYTGLDTAAEKALPSLREKTEGCPACIMAALRQAKIPIPLTSFNFTAECKTIWAEINRAEYERDAVGYPS